ncbi:Acg family FMN-binding oxidoreductase [Streptomyces sp. MS06]|uniref:Acg family FMN-binding oxidoreductase n=1 Tax=Streptomyces sp. MS06 TaxID=3385974 RepID=UPI0039A06440
MTTTVLDAATLERLVSAAVAAPSVHNSQPWRFRLDPDTVTVEVRAETRRALPRLDPSGRALHVSAGCALLNLRVAVAHLGWQPVTRLLPRPEEPELLATVRLAGAARPPADGALHDAVWRRHSSRMPFSAHPLPAALLAELADAAHAEGASLYRPGTAGTERLLGLTRQAERRSAADADRAAESRRWVRRPDESGVGVPPSAVGPQDYRERMPMRDFGAHRHTSLLPARPFEERPVIVLLSTAHDRRADWLRAGQALERVLLLATAHGVRTSMLHQALEWPDLRAALTGEDAEGRRHAQMLLRLGYGPEGPRTPRRAVSRTLEGATEPVPARA